MEKSGYHRCKLNDFAKAEVGQYDEDGNYEEDKVTLGRNLGIISSISFVMGIMIGTGIFLTPAGVLRGTSGSVGLSLIVWLIASFISTCGAMCITELALYFKQSGGDYMYLKNVYGPAISFIRVWYLFTISSPCASAIQCIVIVNFILTPFLGTCITEVPEIGIRLAAICVYLLIVFINCTSSKRTSQAQVFLTIVKIIGLLSIITMGTVKMIQGRTEHFHTPFSTTREMDWTKLPTAFYSAYYATTGWDKLVMITEEVKSPVRTIVRATIISLIVVTVLYMMANVAYLTVLSPEEIMASDAVAALFAVRVVGPFWSALVWFCVVLSASGNLNGSTYSKSRMFFVAARERQFPMILSTIHINRRTPVLANVAIVPLTIIIILAGNIWTIINYLGCMAVVITILITLIVPYLRWKEPNRSLPVKAPIWSFVIYITFNTTLVVFTVITNPLQGIVTIVVALIGLMFYFIMCSIKQSSQASPFISSINVFLQKVTLSVQQEMKTY